MFSGEEWQPTLATGPAQELGLRKPPVKPLAVPGQAPRLQADCNNAAVNLRERTLVTRAGDVRRAAERGRERTFEGEHYPPDGPRRQ